MLTYTLVHFDPCNKHSWYHWYCINTQFITTVQFVPGVFNSISIFLIGFYNHLIYRIIS